MIVKDDLSIYAVKYEPIKYEGDPRFDKEDYKRPWYNGTTAYMYDMQSDREKIIPYFLRVSSMATMTDLVDVRITDYNLDSRLYYYEISFPQTAPQKLPVTIVAYEQAGAKMNPNTDPVLQSIGTTMDSDSVVFEPSIARISTISKSFSLKIIKGVFRLGVCGGYKAERPGRASLQSLTLIR